MTELSNLAKKHDIEGTLFHISNLAKVFNLIGKKANRNNKRVA